MAIANKVDLEDVGKVLDLIHEYPETAHISLFSDSSESLFVSNVFVSIASILDNYKESFVICFKAVTSIDNLINAATKSNINKLNFNSRLPLANSMFAIAMKYKQKSIISNKVTSI